MLIDNKQKITTLRVLPAARLNINLADLCFLSFGLVLALYVRATLIGYESHDYRLYLSPWYDNIRANGGFLALRGDFSNYNPPYLYLLAASAYLPLSKLAAIKLSSIIFDYVLALGVFLLIKRCGPASAWAELAFFTVLFTPTVILNSAMWGQCDSIYTAGLVFSLLWLLEKKPAAACAAFGLALAFKAQAIFFFPVLLLLLLQGRLRFRFLLVTPLVYCLLILPVVILGRPVDKAFTVYLQQADVYEALSMNAPNPYQWLSEDYYDLLVNAGWGFGLAVVVGLLYLFYRFRPPLDNLALIKLSLLFALVMPYTLPKMHERYFYPADILAIILAFYSPRYFWLPLVLVINSFFTYLPFLFNNKVIIATPYLAFTVLAVITFLLYDLLIARCKKTEPMR